MAMERWRPVGFMERWEPFRNVGEIQAEMNRLFDGFFGRPAPSIGAAQGTRLWSPLIDVYETKDDVVLAVELPGVREKDVQVSITGDLLSIRGERRLEGEPGNALHTERVYGRFERTVQLPVPVQAEKVKATYREGVLEVRLPKADEVKPREIKIDIL